MLVREAVVETEKVVSLWDFLGVESDRICSGFHLYEKTNKNLRRECSSCNQRYKLTDFQHYTVQLEAIYLFYCRSQKCRKKSWGGEIRIPAPISVCKVSSERAEQPGKGIKICLVDMTTGLEWLPDTQRPQKIRRESENNETRRPSEAWAKPCVTRMLQTGTESEKATWENVGPAWCQVKVLLLILYFL